MSFVYGRKSFVEVAEDFARLLDEFQRLLVKHGSNTNVRNTKLGFYERQLKEISSLPNQDAAMLASIVTRYNLLNRLFPRPENIKIKDADLMKLLEGASDLQEKGQEYNDTFFELSMALRFLPSEKATVNLDMTTICDVIVNEELAVECKYLHGIKGLRPNLSKGLKQLDERVEKKLASYGFVALDLSALVDHQKIWNFAQSVFSEFLGVYAKLEERNKLAAGGILQHATKDKNFEKIISSFVSLQIESIFYGELGDHEVEKMSKHCLGVLFQCSVDLVFEHDEELLPVSIRAMNYFINPSIPASQHDEIRHAIKNLASGI
ncbi:hypothetical protein [Pseudomonas oryziphila]|uniref:Uncharacterized protein n=1 Tax=Pseudomonas entomophila TaxID=312306 RepID=A0A3Q8U1L3_9PSED|nr:hypothetical protein [Pseudomonas oryziphila]AZL68722.1 hypothetical protein EJA05_13705 [Pseudomonas oryziphila]